VLRFPLEADCLACVPCRKTERQLQAVQRRYEALFALPRLRGFLAPLLADADVAHHARAEALRIRIGNLENARP
jgi:hypothetical protein